MKKFEQFRNTELLSKYSDFNLDEILKNAACNEYWQNKEALWTIISGACNDAGKQFYVSLREYIQSLSDIDTCNINALKSIAHSVDADHLVSFIKENYPPQLLKLINLFSISKSTLLNQFGILHADSIFPKLGAIDMRNEYLDPEKYYIDLIYDIKNNISKLTLLLTENKIQLNEQLINLISNYTDLTSANVVFGLDLTVNSLSKVSPTLTLSNILDMIANIDLYINSINDKHKTVYTVNDFIKLCQLPSFSIKLSETDVEYVNPFFLLIHVFKSNLYNGYINNTLQTSYFDLDSNTTIDLSSLILNIIQTIQMYDDSFVREFLAFHFYGLFYDMIINDNLKNEYVWEGYTPNYISTIGDYSYDEFKDLVKTYITDTELEQFAASVTHFKKIHVDFIQFLSILNYTLDYSKYDDNGDLKNNAKSVNFPYSIAKFNNNFYISDAYNSEKRRLLGLNKSGNVEFNDFILKIALNFTDTCIQISYARENIKTLIQQYSYIGTKKIITNVIREYFIKNFSKRSDWRLQSDTLLNKESDEITSGIFQSINSLNGVMKDSVESQFFNVKLIEYYDNTQYFNIYSDLPSCIVGYKVSGVIPEVSSFISQNDYVSSWVIGGSGIVSSINDNFNIIVPSSVFPKQQTVNINNSQFPVWNAEAVTSVLIPPGTPVSSIIPAGNLITVTSYVDNLVPITGLCATFINDWNSQFWKRDFTKESSTSKLVQDEIKFYENYFPELKMAKTDELKFDIYKNIVYPLLSDMWKTFATSGFTDDPILSALQVEYSGEYPGKYLTQNHANKTFTTIAPLPYVKNLIPEDGSFQETALYLAKPFYENIAYYISLVTKEIINMQTYNNKTGQGLPCDGWKQSYIEFKGYNTYYEDAKNQSDMSLYPSAVIDCDGPWVYSALQKFIKLYYDYPISETSYQIPYKNICEYVDNNYITVGKTIRLNIAKQIYAYQHEIFEKQNYSVHDFQFDQFDNQFTLYKHIEHNEYEDVGEIWVRMKNYPLSVPLMKNVKLKDSYKTYENDVYDTLQCNQHLSYANMWKQLCNNAIKFGVVKSTLWILGYTNWIKTDDTFIESNDDYYLKLGCVQFYKNDELNTLVMDTTTCKFFSLLNGQDNLENINEFIGAYFNQVDKGIEFALYDKTSHRSNIVNSAITKNNIAEQFADTTIPIKVCKYKFAGGKTETRDIFISNTYFPALNICSGEFIYDLNAFKSTHNNNELFYEQLIGEYISGSFLNNNIQFDYYGCLDTLDGKLILNGTLFSVMTNKQNLNDKYISYGMVSADLSEYSGKIYDKDHTPSAMIFWENEELNPTFGIISSFFTIKKQMLLNNNSNGITPLYNNIWRLNSDYVDVNIAYESINPDLINDGVYNDILDDSRNSYYIGVLKYVCPTTTKKVSDSLIDGSGLYTTGFDGIQVKYDYEPIYINDITDKTSLQLIHNKYPKCSINENNDLVVETIITTLGGDKTVYTSKLTNDMISLLSKTIVNDPTLASAKFIETISSNATIKNPDVLSDNDLVPISAGINELISAIKTNDASINKTAGWNTNSWEFNFKSLYDKYSETNDLNNLIKYSNSLSGITAVCQFTPVLTTCLIEPLKIICNFGTYNNKNYDVIGTEYFDLDTKIYIDDNTEKNKAVGWNCGYKKTQYLNWITGDNRYGGPEIVLVDVDTYKTYNLSKLYTTTENPKLDIVVNVCWYDGTQLETKNPSIDVSWKGYVYKYPIKDMVSNSACCDNLVFKLSVDLIKNTVTCYLAKYMPVVTVIGESKKPGFNMSIGYIKLTDIDFEKIKTEYTLIDNKYIKINTVQSIKSMYVLPKLLSLNNDNLINDVKTYLNNNLIINNTEFNNLYIDELSLDSEDIIILNNEKFKVINKNQYI